MPKYKALVELHYPTDSRIVKRILNGEDVPISERSFKDVPVGAIVDDIPTVSVKGLLEAGWIEEVWDN